ncbi:ABC transporter permease [Gaopeijia maritima]|uniref:ABC transporter permease n=1 Tax=Gaopeijia maritima TaxID=3119007 RepID=A0ABU9E5C4_9BACT
MKGVVGAVIRREYLQRVRSRWFVIATIAGPLLMLGLMIVPILIASRGEQADRLVVVVDRTGVLHDRVAEGLERAGYTVESAAGDDAEAALRGRVESDDLGGYLVLDDATIERGTARFVSTSRPSIVRQVALRQIVAQAAIAARIGDAGDDLEALLGGGELDFEVVSDGGIGFDDAAFAASYFGAFILYMTILLYAVAVMRSVLEEKSSRVVEVVISSMRPWQLMLGKILGVGAVGLTQLTIWAASGALIVSAGIPALLAANPQFAQLSELREILPGIGYAGLFAVFFLGGYFMYSGLYAAVGAMCNTDEEAQQAQFPVIMLLVVPIIFVTQVINEPNAPLSVALSLIPFFSPILMFARAAAGAAPLWQVGASVLGMAVTVVAIAWVAGRIYKVGILMAGKRPTLPELWRWVREA